MIKQYLSILLLLNIFQTFSISQVVNMFPKDFQKQIIIDPKNYIDKQTKSSIQKYMKSIQSKKEFADTINILIIIDKYQMNNAWIQTIQRFSNNILNQLYPKSKDRYNSLFIIYSIEDREYVIRTGGYFKSYYQDHYATYNAEQVKTELQQTNYNKAFKLLYKNIDYCLQGKNSYCTQQYNFKKICLFTIIILIFIFILKIICNFCTRLCKKKPRNNKQLKRFQTLQELKKNKNNIQLFIQENCCICLDKLDHNEIQDKKNQEVFLKCGHNFHQNCINNWTKTNNQCPICRQKLQKSNQQQINVIRNFGSDLDILQALININDIQLTTSEISYIDCNSLCSIQCFEFGENLGGCCKCMCELFESCLSGGTSGSW